MIGCALAVTLIGNARAQEVSLPATLASIAGSTKIVHWRGLAYSGFTVHEAPGEDVLDDITVEGIHDDLYSGLSFSMNSEVMTAVGINGHKQLVLSYRVSNSEGASNIGAAKLRVQGAAAGVGFAGAGISLSDKSPFPLATFLGFANVGVSQHLHSDNANDAEVLRGTGSVLGVTADFLASTVAATDSARVASVQHLFALENNVLTGDYNLDGVVNGPDFLVWQRQLGARVEEEGPDGLIDLDADGNRDGRVNASDLAVWAGRFGTGAVDAAIGVPEPITAAGLLAGIVAIVFLVRRRN
jgi:hypothetical protein